MTTLMTTLLDVKNPAVIFGHVHRRQRELADVLLTKTPKRTISYEKATIEDILDEEFIVEFFCTLSGNHHSLEDQGAFDSYCNDHLRRMAARTAAGITEEIAHDVRSAATGAAYAVICPKPTAWDTYTEINLKP